VAAARDLGSAPPPAPYSTHLTTSIDPKMMQPDETQSRSKATELLARHMLLPGRNEVEVPGGFTILVVRE
jgi:hypothetical protein